MRAIIFSKDRACQLHCLLNSIQSNAPWLEPVVIYKTKYYESYEILKDEFQEVEFTEQHLFKDDFLNAIKKGHNCLLVDDDIIFRPIDEVEVLSALMECDILSLRLHEGIRDKKHFTVKSSVDGNIFKSSDLRKMAKEWFSNPNQLEIKLTKHVEGLMMCWLNEAKVIGIPNNRVSGTSKCAHMGGDPNTLNEMYLEGYRIDWSDMNLDHWNVHKNEQYVLKLPI